MAHIPGYNYCGPGTWNMSAPVKSEVDALCREHDMAYIKLKRETGRNPKFFWNEADENLVNGLKRVTGETVPKFIIYTVFGIKRVIQNKLYGTMVKRKRYQKRNKTGRKGKRKYKPRKRRYVRRMRKTMPKRKVYTSAPLERKLYKWGYHKESYRIDRGNTSNNLANECAWSAYYGTDYNELNTRINSLNAYLTSAAGGSIVLDNAIDDQNNFKAYIVRESHITIVNNMERDENLGTDFYPKGNIDVNVYFCTPKFPDGANPTNVLVDLQTSFTTNGFSNDLTSVDKKFYSCSNLFKRNYRVTSYGKYVMNPGEQRTFRHKCMPKWWLQNTKAVMGSEYSKFWNGFWLVRQQGQPAMRSISEPLNPERVFYAGSRLTCMLSEYVKIYYKQTVGNIKSHSLVLSSTLQNATVEPLKEYSEEVSEEPQSKKRFKSETSLQPNVQEHLAIGYHEEL